MGNDVDSGPPISLSETETIFNVSCLFQAGPEEPAAKPLLRGIYPFFIFLSNSIRSATTPEIFRIILSRYFLCHFCQSQFFNSQAMSKTILSMLVFLTFGEINSP